MPELPEVETTRRGLAPHLVGRTVTALDIRQWVIIGACAAIALMILTEVRRRRGKRWEDVIIGHTDPVDVHLPPDGSPGAGVQPL